MRKIISSLTLTVIVLFSYIPSAYALLGDTIGVGVRAISMGEAFVAIADDYSATYYNPAGLGQLKDTFKLSIDYIYAAPQFKVTRLSDGQDLKNVGPPDPRDRTTWDPVKTAADDNLDDINHSRPIIGISANMNKICSALNIPKNLNFGMIIMVPNNFRQTLTLTDYLPDVPKFTRFGDADEQIFMAFGLGLEWIEDLLYFGIAGKLEIYGDGDVHNNNADVAVLGIDPGAPTEEKTLHFQMQINWSVYGGLNPIVGVLYTPFDKKLKIGFTYREETLYKIGPSNLIMNYGSGTGEQTFNMPWNAIVDFLIAYQPEEWALGVAYDFHSFTVSFGLELQKWSGFPWSDVYWTDYYYGEEGKVDRLEGYRPYGPDFDDVYNISLGMEYRYSKYLTIMAGYQHSPTPVPDQSGRITNYLDMDKNIFSIGANYLIYRDRIKIGAVFEYMLCDDYKVNNDGVKGFVWPVQDEGVYQDSYKVEGDVYLLGLSVEINF
jgi:long-chain fatty acid transport protein